MNKINKIKHAIFKKFVFKFSKLDRYGISANFIKGSGIEIGGLNYPLVVKPGVLVKYVDRVSAESHLSILNEFKKEEIVKVDIIDDGEILSTIADNSQDFVIGNHFIEHTRNPILAIKNALRVLKPGGVVFMAIPDKRYTFDINRQNTSLDHLLKDYVEGPDWSEEDHYFDFVKNTEHGEGKTLEEMKIVINELKNRNFSIHYHVWDHQSMIDMFCMIKNELHFQFELQLCLSAKVGRNESIFILQKQ
jgi:SAM-dependent methyltransferase